jgi:hypothetical protein
MLLIAKGRKLFVAVVLKWRVLIVSVLVLFDVFGL